MVAGDCISRNPERQAARLLPQPVPGRVGRSAHRLDHPVRIHRRAPRVSMLGRTRAQSELQSDPGCRRTSRRDLERRPGERKEIGGRQKRGRLQRDDPDVDLPGRVHRRRVRCDCARRCRHAAQNRSRPRQAVAHQLGGKDRRLLAQVLRRVLRSQVSR